MNDTANSEYIALRVESGLHVGTVIELSRGETAIGSGTGSDIVLLDSEIAPRHALVRLSEEDGVSVSPLSGHVLVDGEALSEPDTPARLTDGRSMTLGTVCLTLIAAHDSRETVSGAEFMSGPGRLSDRWRLLRSMPRMPCLSRRTWVAAQAVLVSGGLLASGIWAASLLSARDANASAASQLASDMDSLDRWLTSHDVEGVEVHAEGGRIVLEGIPASATMLSGLDRKIGRLDSRVVNRVTAGAGTADRIRNLLMGFGLTGVDVQPRGSGRYAVSGFVGLAEDWEAIRQTVLRDIPGVASLDDRDALTSEAFRKRFRTALADAGLDGDVYVSVDGHGGVEFVGIAGADALRRWRDLKMRFKRHLARAGAPALNDRVHSTADALGVEIRSISSGDVSYLTTADGKRFLEGGRLPGGYRVEAIGPDVIRVVRNGETFNLQYGK